MKMQSDKGHSSGLRRKTGTVRPWWRGSLYVRGRFEAGCEARRKKDVAKEMGHYAMLYSLEGPVTIKIVKVAAKRKLRRKTK